MTGLGPTHGSGRGSGRLRLLLRLAEPGLAALTGRFWEQPDLGLAYPRYLLALHGFVRATVPLLELAEERASTLAPSDVLGRPLAAYFHRHRQEEEGHEEWLLADLEAAGLGREEALARPASAAVAALAGAQYYWLRHAHPVALLGCFAVLEGYPPVGEQIDDVERRTGLPSACFRMLREHAARDPAHGAEVLELIDALPIDEARAALVATSALHTMASLGAIYTELLDRPYLGRPAPPGARGASPAPPAARQA